MERLCHYCQKPYRPKRTDALYCSHSCRQLTYVLRKARESKGIFLSNVPKSKADTSNTFIIGKEPLVSDEDWNNNLSVEKEFEGLDALETSIKDRKNNCDPSVQIQNSVLHHGELSIHKDKYDLDPSTGIPDLSKQLQNNELDKSDPSIKKSGAVNRESSLSVNTDKVRVSEEKQTIHESPYLNELIEFAEARNHLFKLSNLFNLASADSSFYWISMRYKCLIDCLLAFSEMPFVPLDDLKEVCNAFTGLIESRSYSYLPLVYPYTSDMVSLRSYIRTACINSEQQDTLTLRLKKETKFNLLATRWELAHYFPKMSFDQLEFTE